MREFGNWLDEYTSSSKTLLFAADKVLLCSVQEEASTDSADHRVSRALNEARRAKHADPEVSSYEKSSQLLAYSARCACPPYCLGTISLL